jgi:Na+-transporting NADH:ubiquinone oxidoreductase subunit NqrB
MMLFRRILTYRLGLYYLAAIVAAAFILSVAGIVHQAPVNLAFSTAVTLGTCLIVNWAFARAFGAGSNWESVSISALIIALIITPVAPNDFSGAGFLILVSAWAMASKYMVAISKRHLFNPAAFGAALMGITLHHPVSWWVGDNALLLAVIIPGGALMLTRLRYTEMVAAFAVVVLGITIAYGNLTLDGIGRSFSMMGIHSMFCFFGLVMLTEPRTVPVGRWRQIVHGALVGFLFSPFTHIGSYYFTPEVAILGGNLFTFFSNKRRIRRWADALALGGQSG